MYKLSVFIFRRDLRVNDNYGLIQALKNSENVIPLFVLNPNQLTGEYASPRCVNFMLESLADLNHQLNNKLYVQYGDVINILTELHHKFNYDAVYVNADYTPFSRARDAHIAGFCQNKNIKFHSYHDILLLSDGDLLLTKSYKKFTPFYLHVMSTLIKKIPAVRKNNNKNYLKLISNTRQLLTKHYDKSKINRGYIGGRKNGLKILQNAGKFRDYEKYRDLFSYNTTRLSAHLKFGTISIREAYYAFKRNASIIRQLLWRDFYYYLAMHDPNCLKTSYSRVKTNWSTNYENYKKWRTGKTGVKVVDYCMNKLNTTGYISNRMRLIVADYLVKHLRINWQLGEKYFAQVLIDYDPIINNYNWQWIASTGPFARPIFQRFNPETQAARFADIKL